MSAENRLRQVFLAALERSPAEREAFLAEACAGDAMLRARVEALLAAHDAPESYLERPVLDVTSDADVDPHRGMDDIGSEIGPYKILQKIGEGGFGVVYMAEQRRPVQRQVALKLIKPGMDSKEVIARFEAERQALALMDHPNIAKVLDANATAGGRPYFVMELVKGVPITRFCDEANLPTRERLALFVAVCRAVQHAHQKGVIHRDLKPSNVMVTLHDGEPVPKVIDFGISKAISQRLTERTLFTRYGQMVGTPQYMSPEQAEMSGLDVDTRSDVYSLGVLLYELLTGTTPLDVKKLRAAAYDEMLRLIREEEPPKPSTRVSTLEGKLAAISKHRSIDSKQLRRSLQGDLDWIVMKTLEKDRRRRYQTALDLAADVERHLKDEPVQAGRPSAGYRLRKFARRNRRFATGAATIAVAIVIGLALALAGFFEASRERNMAVEARARAETARNDARKQRDSAQQQRQRAEEQSAEALEAARRARKITSLLNDLLATANPESAKGADYKVRQLLDDFAATLDLRLQGEPAVETEIRNTVGRAYHELWQSHKAIPHLRRSVELLRTNAYKDDVRLADGLSNLGWALFASRLQESMLRIPGEHADESESLFREALQLYRKSEIQGPKLVKAMLGLANSMHFIRNQNQKALALYEEALSAAETDSTDAMLAVKASVMHNYAACLAATDASNLQRAEKIVQEAIRIHRGIGGDDYYELGMAFRVLGYIQSSRANYKESVSSNSAAIRIVRHNMGPGSALEALALNDLRYGLQCQMRFEEAIAACEEARSLWVTTGNDKLLGHVLRELAFVEMDRANHRIAEDLIDEALERFEKQYGPRDPRTLELSFHHGLTCFESHSQERRQAGIETFANFMRLTKDAVELEFMDPTILQTYAISVAIVPTASADDVDLAIAAISRVPAGASVDGGYMLGLLLEKQGKLSDAVAAFRDANTRVAVGDLTTRRNIERDLSRVLLKQGKAQEAEAVWRDGIARRRQESPANHWEVSLSKVRLADFLIDQSRFDEAEALLREAQTELQSNPQAIEAHHELVREGIAKLADARMAITNNAKLPE